MTSPKSLTSPTVPWCDLHVDPCSIIIGHIDVVNVLNFSSTCRRWASLCKCLNVTVLETGKPTLITSQPVPDGGMLDEDDLRSGKFGIHVVSKGLSFCCENKGLKSRCWIGGKDNWLVTTNTSVDVELLNPITHSTVSLSSFNNNDDGMVVEYGHGLRVTIDPFTRFFRPVLSRTPSHQDGYEAIALFSDGLLAYTAQGENAWRVLKNPTDHDDNAFNYYPEVFFDAIVYHGWVFVVDEDGAVFAWDVSSETLVPVELSSIDTLPSEDSKERVFYLVITPGDQLMLVCLYGHGNRYLDLTCRMVWNEHHRFERLDGISLHQFDDDSLTWRCVSTIGRNQSLFIGLNYPFFVTSPDLTADSVYLADMVKYDVVICTMENEGSVRITKQDYPVDETARLLDGYSVRTLMWFRPPAAARDKM